MAAVVVIHIVATGCMYCHSEHAVGIWMTMHNSWSAAGCQCLKPHQCPFSGMTDGKWGIAPTSCKERFWSAHHQILVAVVRKFSPQMYNGRWPTYWKKRINSYSSMPVRPIRTKFFNADVHWPSKL